MHMRQSLPHWVSAVFRWSTRHHETQAGAKGREDAVFRCIIACDSSRWSPWFSVGRRQQVRSRGLELIDLMTPSSTVQRPSAALGFRIELVSVLSIYLDQYFFILLGLRLIVHVCLAILRLSSGLPTLRRPATIFVRGDHRSSTTSGDPPPPWIEFGRTEAVPCVVARCLSVCV